MESSETTSFRSLMRRLHRDTGFLVLGLTLIYALTGMLMIYRDTGLLKQEHRFERQAAAHLPPQELAKLMRVREVQIQKTEGDVLTFKNGTYNKTTGALSYTEQSLPAVLEKLTSVHKAVSKNTISILNTMYGAALLFMAVSSLWMFKPNSRLFKRGMIFAGTGIAIAVVLILW